MKPLFEYLDYRQYIRDYYEEKKSLGAFSYRIFAKQAGFSSPVFIKMVIEHKSNLSRDGAAKLAKAMGLVKENRKFFHTLVKYDQAESIDEKMVHLTELKQLTSNTPVFQLNSDQIKFFSSWIHPVVREIIRLSNGTADPQKIAETFIQDVSAEEISHSIEILKHLGFLVEQEDGTLASEDTVVSAKGLALGNLVIRATQKAFVEMASSAIEHIPPEERNISGLTLAFAESDMEQVSQELQHCRNRIIEIAQNSDSDRVYRLNFHLYPLTTRLGDK